MKGWLLTSVVLQSYALLGMNWVETIKVSIPVCSGVTSMHLRYDKYQYSLNTQHKNKLLNLHFTFKHVIWLNFASFESFQNSQLVAFLFILNLHKPAKPRPKSRVFDWLRHNDVKVFVSLCSYSTGMCVRGFKQIDIETVGKNNRERIIKKLRYRGGVYNVWR